MFQTQTNSNTITTFRYNLDRWERRDVSQSQSGVYTNYYSQAFPSPETEDGRLRLCTWITDSSSNW